MTSSGTLGFQVFPNIPWDCTMQMTNANHHVDRRKHGRFQAKDGSFAMLSLQLAALGQITNISSGGLAFCYVASRDRSRESSGLNILLSDGSFSLNKLPVKAVWDHPIPRNYSFGLITVRHCGMQFDGLTDDQESGLRYFLREHTIDRPEVQSPSQE